jgi:glycosyltransferase involved in cell wall biosynthesis
MKVLVVTQYFPPEVGAAQERLRHYVEYLESAGHHVTVLTAMPSYPWRRKTPPYRSKAFCREWRRSARVIRTWVSDLGDDPNVLDRMLHYASFFATSLPALLYLGPRFDVALVESPPLTTAFSALILRALGTPYVLSVSDIWPKSAVALGALHNAAVIRLLERLEHAAYRYAGAIVALTNGINGHVSSQGWGRKTFMIPNGVDPADFPVPEHRATRESFEVIYAGTVGLAHGLEGVLDAMDLLRDEDVALTIIGEGAAKPRLLERARRMRLDNVHLLPARPRSEVLPALSGADAILVSLAEAPILRGAVPAKLYEAMATGRPVILAAAGEAADLFQRIGAGIAVPPGDPVRLADAIRSMRASSERETLGGRGREFVLRERDVRSLAARLEAVLTDVRDGSGDRSG